MLNTSFPLWILLFFQAVQTMSQQGVTISNVEIKSNPEHPENVKEGSTITLTCSANVVIPPGRPSRIWYSFYKGSKKDFLLENVTSHQQYSRYTIQPARASHSGYYQCVMGVGSTRETSDSTIFITVKGRLQRPVLTINPLEVTVGNSTELRCETSEEIPPLTFIFYKYKNGQASRLAETKDTSENVVTHPLKVTGSTEKNYSCTVYGYDDDSISDYSETASITVRPLAVSKPTLQSEPNKDTLKKGQTLRLKCTVSKGSFPITYTFFNGSKIFNKTFPSNEAVYRINSVNKYHSGRYYCEASNAATSEAKQSQHINIKVTDCSQVAVPEAWTLVTTLLLSVSTVCSN